MFTPERLVLARKRRRMTLAALARVSGISAQSITAFENHRKTPTPETVSRLAVVLGFPAEFFTAAPLPEIPPAAVSFRAPSKMSAAERDSALAAGVLAVAVNTWMVAHFRLPAPNIPTYPSVGAEEAAERLRARWGLGEAPVPNLVHLVEANGVRVFSLPSDCLTTDAFSTLHAGTPFVLLNTRKSGERGRFDVAHELGHLVLHCEYRTPTGRVEEAEANDFAAAFLMPRAGVLAQHLTNAPLEQILVAKRTWGVSAMALTYRLRSLGLLTEWRYNSVVKQLAQAGYRRAEPDSVMPRESSQLLAKVFEALRSRGIPATDLAAHTHLTLNDLNDYMFGLIPTSITGGGQRTPTPTHRQLRLVGR